MKTGEATCRIEHAQEWDHEGRVNPCGRCFSSEYIATDLATATPEDSGDQA